MSDFANNNIASNPVGGGYKPCLSNINWIDISKFIGIFLVIVGHSLYFTYNKDFYTNLHSFIFAFHMPLFFIIAGILHKNKEKKDSLSKILWCLFIPYILYQIIYLPFIYVTLVLNHGKEPVSCFIYLLCSIVTGDGYYTDFSYPCCYPCWFIITFIHIKLIFTFLKINLKSILIISSLSIMILKYLMHINYDLIFCLDSTLMALPYFCLGILLKNYFINYRPTFFTSILQICLALISLLLIIDANGVIELIMKINEKISDKSLLLSYLGGIIGTIMIFLFAKMFTKTNKFIDTISKNTLFIIFYHVLILHLFRWAKIQNYLINTPNLIVSLASLLIISFLVLVISYYSIIILQKYCPLLLGKYKPKTTK